MIIKKKESLAVHFVADKGKQLAELMLIFYSIIHK